MRKPQRSSKHRQRQKSSSYVGRFALTRTDLISALTFTANYNPWRSWNLGHVWSLSVEEQFYCSANLATAFPLNVGLGIHRCGIVTFPCRTADAELAASFPAPAKLAPES